jgi:hypothetical protein
MGAIRIAHEILYKILDIEIDKKIRDRDLQLSEHVPENLLNDLKGRYGPSKGFLTNVRFYKSGGEIKIRYNGSNLRYKTMWGDKKHGVKLWLYNKDEPLHYKILDNISYNSLEPYETVIFKKDQNGDISSFLKGFNEYYKKPWYKTFKFKFYSRILCIILLLMGVIFILQGII